MGLIATTVGGDNIKALNNDTIKAENTIDTYYISSFTNKNGIDFNDPKFILGDMVSTYRLNDILVPLAKCESGFHSICILDTNNKLSCGIFQFQQKTFETYCPDLKWNNSVKEDVICANRVIFQGYLTSNWVNCSKIIGD